MAVKRVVVDTNIIVSALTAGGTPQKIIQAWIAGKFLAVLSEELKQEINVVLNRSKLAKFDSKRKVLLGTLFNQALLVLPRSINEVVFSDPDDHFLLELAITAKAAAIVTGDKGLLDVRKIKGVEILNPAQFCKKYRI